MVSLKVQRVQVTRPESGPDQIVFWVESNGTTADLDVHVPRGGADAYLKALGIKTYELRESVQVERNGRMRRDWSETVVG
jgi:hypothetical protein